MFIALTGGIGCGKSAALECFSRNGIFCTDADKICHEFYTTSEGISKVAACWPSVLDENGAIDRKKLGNIVFRDENDLAFLEGIVTPYLFERINAYRAKSEPVIMEIPLLFEKNMQDLCDKIICIWSPFALRRQRLAARNWDHAECSRRERLQWDPDKKLAAADYGIINTGTLEELEIQCRSIMEKLEII